MESLTKEQRRAVRDAEFSVSAEKAGAAVGGVIAGGASVVVFVMSMVGGLLGWLLVMKEKVLQCKACGAVVAAS